MVKGSSRSKTSCLISREESIEYVGDVLQENAHHLFFDFSTSIMHVLHNRNVSIIWASFLMKIVGLWLAADQNEQRRRDFALIYTLGALFISICIALRDIYHTWGNFSVSAREFDFDRFVSSLFIHSCAYCARNKWNLRIEITESVETSFKIDLLNSFKPDCCYLILFHKIRIRNTVQKAA